MPSNFVARGPEAYNFYMGRWNKRLASGFLEFAGLVEGGARLASRAPVRVFRRRVGVRWSHVVPLKRVLHVEQPPGWRRPKADAE